MDESGKWVNAQTTPFKRSAIYFCECPQKHRLKHVKPTGKREKRSFSDYFAHISTGSKRKQSILNHDNVEVQCSGAGESMKHRLAKHKLRECINSVSFVIEACISCTWEKVLTFTECTVRLEISSADGLWRYDCLVYNSEGAKFYALEVAHTHFSSERKVLLTRHCGLGIAEFLADDVLQWESANKRLQNLLCQKIHCKSCSLKLICDAQLWQYEQEVDGWLDLEDIIFASLLKELKHTEFKNNLMLLRSPIDQAKAVVEQYQQIIWIESGRLWKICLEGRISRSLGGFLINVSSNSFIPVDYVFLLVLDRDWDIGKAERIRMELRAIWEQHSICSDLVYAICCNTILNRINILHQGGCNVFRCCLFPIFKRVEKDHQLCANCGGYGHSSEVCRRRFCTRCGRRGHSSTNCFASSTVNGRIME